MAFSSRNPKLSDPSEVFTCENCGEGILPGYEFTNIEGKVFCRDCLDNMTTPELLSLCGYRFETAELD